MIVALIGKYCSVALTGHIARPGLYRSNSLAWRLQEY